MMAKCSIDGCERRSRCRGWCDGHYSRWLRYGDPCGSKARETTPLEERFWNKVQKTEGCWLWTGACNPGGYGHLSRGGRGDGHITASRLSYILAHGEIPEEQLVLHKCDNRICVNPGHLFLGTYKDNMQDASQKGRICHGENIHNSKLSECDISNIRIEYAKGDVSQAALAKFFDVNQATIWSIISGKTWKRVAA